MDEARTELTGVNVIIFPRGQVSERDRVALNGIGFTVVEADDPSKVVTTVPMAPFVSADDVFASLVTAMTKNACAAGDFGRALVIRLNGGEGA